MPTTRKRRKGGEACKAKLSPLTPGPADQQSKVAECREHESSSLALARSAHICPVKLQRALQIGNLSHHRDLRFALLLQSLPQFLVLLA